MNYKLTSQFIQEKNFNNYHPIVDVINIIQYTWRMVEIPKGNPEKSTEVLYWYRPKLSHDDSGLRWTAVFDTYDLKTHIKGTEASQFDFQAAGITNPVFARAAIGLAEMNLLTYTTLEGKLNQVKLDPPKANSLIDFLSNGKDDSGNIKKAGESEGMLTNNFLRIVGVPKFNCIETFDLLSKHDQPQAALRTIDSFISFYNESRAIILNRAEQVARKPSDDPTLIMSDPQIAEEIFKDGKKDKAFIRIVSLIANFLAQYSEISKSSFPQAIATNSRSDEQTAQFDPSILDELWEKYQEELTSGYIGLAALLTEYPYYGPQERMIYETKLERKTSRMRTVRTWKHSLYRSDSSRTVYHPNVKNLGECPFFVIGYREEK